jgi:hypothetical protein
MATVSLLKRGPHISCRQRAKPAPWHRSLLTEPMCVGPLLENEVERPHAFRQNPARKRRRPGAHEVAVIVDGGVCGRLWSSIAPDLRPLSAARPPLQRSHAS